MKTLITFFLIAFFTLFANANESDFRLGVDYKLVDNPLPVKNWLLYKSPRPRDVCSSRMPSSA